MEKSQPKEWYEDTKRRRVILINITIIGFVLGAVAMMYLDGFVFERASPKIRIHRSMIHVYDDKIVLDIKEPLLTSYTGTNSMEPTLDNGMYGVAIRPVAREDIQVGDIIGFNKNNSTIAHRVVRIGWDDDGWYALTKGDNKLLRDFIKVRWHEVMNVQVGVLY